MEEQLLLLDRQAILGRLSAGLVHAMNNVLSGVLGQVDLLLLVRVEPQVETDLNQIATTCEQGVLLTRSLSRVITALGQDSSTDAQPIVEAMHVLLGRIFRRGGVEAETDISRTLPSAQNGSEFVQAVFHLLLMSYDSLSVSGVTSRKISIRLSLKDEQILLELESLTPLLPEFQASPPQPGQDILVGREWQRWVLDTVCRRAGGNWYSSDDGKVLSLLWPASSSASTTLY